MSNELYNTIARVTDGIYEGIYVFLLFCMFLCTTLCYACRWDVTKYECACWIFVGIAIGGDVFPGSTLSDHVLRFNNIPQVCYCSYIFLLKVCLRFSLCLFGFPSTESGERAVWLLFLLVGIHAA